MLLHSLEVSGCKCKEALVLGGERNAQQTPACSHMRPREVSLSLRERKKFTLAPFFRSISVIAFPIPTAAPVTTAVLELRSIVSLWVPGVTWTGCPHKTVTNQQTEVGDYSAVAPPIRTTCRADWNVENVEKCNVFSSLCGWVPLMSVHTAKVQCIIHPVNGSPGMHLHVCLEQLD